MSVWVLTENVYYGFYVVGIYTSEEQANKIREEKLKPYKYDVSDNFKIHEVELNKELNGDIGYYE